MDDPLREERRFESGRGSSFFFSEDIAEPYQPVGLFSKDKRAWLNAGGPICGAWGKLCLNGRSSRIFVSYGFVEGTGFFEVLEGLALFTGKASLAGVWAFDGEEPLSGNKSCPRATQGPLNLNGEAIKLSQNIQMAQRCNLEINRMRWIPSNRASLTNYLCINVDAFELELKAVNLRRNRFIIVLGESAGQMKGFFGTETYNISCFKALACCLSVREFLTLKTEGSHGQQKITNQ